MVTGHKIAFINLKNWHSKYSPPSFEMYVSQKYKNVQLDQALLVRAQVAKLVTKHEEREL